MIAPLSVLAATSLPPVDLVWVFGTGSGEQRDVALVEDAANKYLKDKINATIKLVAIDWSAYQQKRDLMIAAGEKMDICFSGGWNGYFENLSKGSYLEISALLDQYAPKTKALIVPALWNGARFKGGIYGIPANKEAAQDWGVLYRKDLTDKYGIDMSKIKTMKDFEKILYQIHKLDPNLICLQNAVLEQMTGAFEKWDNVGPEQMLSVVSNSDGTFKAFDALESPEYMEAWQWSYKLYQDGLENKDVLIRQEMSTAQNAGQVFSFGLNLKPYKDNEVNAGAPKGMVWKQIDMTKAIANQDAVAGSLQNLPISCKNPERAMMLLELFNTDKYLNNLINFGIEGKHYKKTGPNRIDYADGVTPANSGYNPQSQWMFGNTFLNYLWPSEKDDKYVQYQKYNQSAVASKIVSFVFDQIQTIQFLMQRRFDCISGIVHTYRLSRRATDS
jgi:putative aldouronate transport system substrate-binding protein